MTSEWGGKHQGKTLDLGAFNRINVIVYDGGTQTVSPEIHIIETYPPRADGVIESGGRLLTTVPFKDEEQASEFNNSFAQALRETLPKYPSDYESTSSQRDQIRILAKNTYDALTQ